MGLTSPQGIPYMSGDAIRAYKSPPSIDCEAELAALGLTVARDFLLFLQKVVCGKVSDSKLGFFGNYRGIQLYRKTIKKNAVVFATELESGNIVVSILLATPVGAPVSIDGKLWDGRDLIVLRGDILDPRLRDYFI
jgi:hypothetical protein